VLIEDSRPLPPTKAVEVMELSVAEDIGPSSGEWRASAHELLSRLQESCAAIEGGSIICTYCTIHSLLLSLGAVKLSYPDPTDPQYRQYFVKMVGGESLADAKTSPSSLVIPATGVVQIFIEMVHTCTSYVESLPTCSQADVSLTPFVRRSPMPDADYGNWQFDDDGRQPKRARRTAKEKYCTEFLEGRKQARNKLDQQEIAWLEQQAAEQPGYTEFKQSKGKILPNPDIVVSWKFAAAFVSKYVGKLGVGHNFLPCRLSLTHKNRDHLVFIE
jgi:hypothetical protein